MRQLIESGDMGGKRSDQIPMNPPATDRKSRVEDEHIHEEDKQALHNERGKLAIKRGENPALKALKSKKRDGGE